MVKLWPLSARIAYRLCDPVGFKIVAAIRGKQVLEACHGPDTRLEPQLEVLGPEDDRHAVVYLLSLSGKSKDLSARALPRVFTR